MRIRRVRDADGSPRTVVGRWLLASVTGDTETRTQVAKHLNGGRPTGMNDDEPAVVSCACHLGLVRLQERRGASAPWELVDVMLRNMSDDNRPPREEAGAVATASLLEPIAKVPGLTQGQVFSLQFFLFYASCRSLALAQDDAGRLIREAENLAIELDFSPPILQS